MSWSLSDIMANAQARAAFRAYLQTQYATENFDFLRAVQAYRIRPSKSAAKAIIDQYISPTAHTPVNISGPDREDIGQRLPKRFRPWNRAPADLFDDAARTVISPTFDYVAPFLATNAGVPYRNDPAVRAAPIVPPLTGAERAARDAARAGGGMAGMGDALAGAGDAAGGGRGIGAPPRAPDPAPRADPPGGSTGGRGDGRGRDRNADERKTEGRGKEAPRK